MNRSLAAMETGSCGLVLRRGEHGLGGAGNGIDGDGGIEEECGLRLGSTPDSAVA